MVDVKTVKIVAFIIIIFYFFYEIAVNVLGNLISEFLVENGIKGFPDLVRFCILNWLFLVPIIIIIIAVLLYVLLIVQEHEFAKIWEFFKPVKKLTKEDFKIQKYKMAYIRRESDATIDHLLNNGDWVLIIGKPKLGKTRAAYETIKKLKNFSVIKPSTSLIF